MDIRESISIPESGRSLAELKDRVKPEQPTEKAKPARPEAVSKPPAKVAAEKNTWQTNPKVQEIIESLQGHDSQVSVAMDPETRRVVITVLDSRTGETIRKIPLQDPIKDDENKLTGLLLDTTE